MDTPIKKIDDIVNNINDIVEQYHLDFHDVANINVRLKNIELFKNRLDGFFKEKSKRKSQHSINIFLSGIVDVFLNLPSIEDDPKMVQIIQYIVANDVLEKKESMFLHDELVIPVGWNQTNKKYLTHNIYGENLRLYRNILLFHPVWVLCFKVIPLKVIEDNDIDNISIYIEKINKLISHI